MTMAFGIDDTLTTAAAGISLADTIVSVIKNYRGGSEDIDIETLIDQVRIEAMRRINVADGALAAFENLIHEKNVDIDLSMIEAIKNTSMWNWRQRYVLKSINRQFSEFHKSVYDAIDDVAALVQCKGQTLNFGSAVAESARRKSHFQEHFLSARTLREKINILRGELNELKISLK